MANFTADNYDATEADLSNLNAALVRLLNAYAEEDRGMVERNVADRICNVFESGMTTDEIVAAVNR